jgi:hypothetical protein
MLFHWFNLLDQCNRISAAASVHVVSGSWPYGPEDQEPLYTKADGGSLALSASFQANVFRLIPEISIDENTKTVNLKLEFKLGERVQ